MSRDSTLGEKGAYASTLRLALNLMDADQLSALLEEATSFLESTETVLSRRGESAFLEGLMTGYKMIAFDLRQAHAIARGDEAPAQEVRFVCIECGWPWSGNISDTSGCVSCGSRLIDTDRVEPPED